MKQLLRKNWVLLLILMGITMQGHAQLTFSKRVDASTDDAEEQGADGSSPGTMDLTSSDLELVRDGNDGNQFVGIRFSNVLVPSSPMPTFSLQWMRTTTSLVPSTFLLRTPIMAPLFLPIPLTSPVVFGLLTA